MHASLRTLLSSHANTNEKRLMCNLSLQQNVSDAEPGSSCFLNCLLYYCLAGFGCCCRALFLHSPCSTKLHFPTSTHPLWQNDVNEGGSCLRVRTLHD